MTNVHAPRAPGLPLKSLMVAFLLLCAAAAGLFAILRYFGVDDKTAVPAAGSLFTAITYVQQALDSELKGFGLLPSKLVTFEGYTIPWKRMVVYCTFILLAVQNVASLLAGIAVGMGGMGLENAVGVVGIFVPILMAGAVYLLAFWIGRRADSHPILTMLLFVGLSLGITKCVDYFLTPPEMWREILGRDATLGDFVVGASVLFAALGVVGMISVWRGKKARLAGYLQYLLNIVPRDTRESLISLAYEEADKLLKEQSEGAPVAATTS